MLFCSCLVPLLLWVSLAAAAASNRTIDDQNGDSISGTVPIYAPSSSWKQGATCDGCFIQLNTADVHDGTWHDATHSPNDAQDLTITATFTGTAVYVFNVLANTVQYTTTFTTLTFTLDGTEVGDFTHNPSTSTDFQYGVLTFSKTGLANEPHTLVITSGGDASSLVLFDYMVYT
ncbi:uncharacterized protein BXZ73DRAFT_54860, partial [Epithele typhae]|uniref:uncharacterized protein n=1 Tax=Epithele typhae TaxID=378194 RepID=UPI002008369B